jgi:translation elongation factor aEF-1 beta
MGNVAVTFRIMPDEAGTDLEAMKTQVRKALGTAFRDLREEEVAFGLKAVVAIAVVSDSAGGTDRLEQSLGAVPGVGSVETVDVTLV